MYIALIISLLHLNLHLHLHLHLRLRLHLRLDWLRIYCSAHYSQHIMGMEVEVTKSAQGDATLVSDKENKAATVAAPNPNPAKDSSDPIPPVPLPAPALGVETAKQDGGIQAPNTASVFPPKDATDEWGTPKQTYTFYFAKLRMIDDPKVKTKLDQLHKSINNNKAHKANLLSQLADKRVSFTFSFSFASSQEFSSPCLFISSLNTIFILLQFNGRKRGMILYSS